MATQFPELVPVPLVDPIAIAINQSIDRLVLSLEQRRSQLLTQLRNTREEMRHNRVALHTMEQQIAETRAFLEREITHNELHSMQERIVADLESKMAELQASAPPPQEVVFRCHVRDLEEHIARLGEIVRLNITPIPDYAAFQQPNAVVGEQGSAPGELDNPRGVSVSPESGDIYVADMLNSRIQIFSQTGDYLDQFGRQHLVNPWGILIHQDNIYVTDWKLHSILLFKIADHIMLKRVGKLGSGSREFKSPRQLAISPENNICVADKDNNRIQILSTDLEFNCQLLHETMKEPVDIKFTNKELFVLSRVDNPCIHVFSLSGEKLRSIVTKEANGMQQIQSYFFCFDRENNIIISDWTDDNIKVFSPAGDLLHTIGQYGHRAGTFAYPNGIAIHQNKLICVSQNNNNALQIFSDNFCN